MWNLEKWYRWTYFQCMNKKLWCCGTKMLCGSWEAAGGATFDVLRACYLYKSSLQNKHWTLFSLCTFSPKSENLLQISFEILNRASDADLPPPSAAYLSCSLHSSYMCLLWGPLLNQALSYHRTFRHLVLSAWNILQLWLVNPFYSNKVRSPKTSYNPQFSSEPPISFWLHENTWGGKMGGLCSAIYYDFVPVI